MDFWLLDVKSTREVDGKKVAFDYINTYFSCKKAIKKAKLLSIDENVLEVSVHHWILKFDGTQEHAEKGDNTDVPYRFLNRNHWEITEEEKYEQSKDRRYIACNGRSGRNFGI